MQPYLEIYPCWLPQTVACQQAGFLGLLSIFVSLHRLYMKDVIRKSIHIDKNFAPKFSKYLLLLDFNDACWDVIKKAFISHDSTRNRQLRMN